MLVNIIVGVMCALAVGAGLFGWWLENGRSDKKDDEKDDKETDGKDAK